MAILGAPQKLIVVLVLIVAVMALVLGIVIGHGLTVIPLNTTTQLYPNVGHGWQLEGEWPGGEILNSQQYATSWDQGDQSEPIMPRAYIVVPGVVVSCVDAYRYEVQTTHDGVTWTDFPGSPFTFGAPGSFGPGDKVPMSAPTLYETGPFVGGIRVTISFKISDPCGVDRGWNAQGQDQAYLISGTGSVVADPQAQVGTVAHATVTVAYLAGNGGGHGWELYAFSTAQNRVVFGPVYSNTSGWSNLEQTFSYQIQPGDFSSAAGTCGNGNRIEWHLFNELFPKDTAWTTTVDVSSLSPTFHFKGWSGSPVSGGAINVTFSAAPNGASMLPLTKIVLGYGYGDTNHFLNLTGNATSAQIPLGSNGNLRINGYAIDSGCRPSPVDSLTIYVFPQGQQPPGNGPPNWLLFFGILAIFAVIGVAVAYFVKGPLWTRLVLLAFIVLAGVVIALLAQPQVLQPNLYAVLPWGVGRWR